MTSDLVVTSFENSVKARVFMTHLQVKGKQQCMYEIGFIYEGNVECKVIVFLCTFLDKQYIL